MKQPGQRVLLAWIVRHKSDWVGGVLPPETNPINLATFTRYCEGCGLTVKMVKPELEVETIKPPEFACKWKTGLFSLADSRDAAEEAIRRGRYGPGRLVRIDWGKALS